MEIFNPAHCNAKVKTYGGLFDYGEGELEVLLQHYGKSKTVDGRVFKTMVDNDAARFEWDLLKDTVHKWSKDGHQSKRRLWEQQLTSGALDSLPAMRTLVYIMLTLPYKTACCERGFSAMKLIKTASRNRMYIETLDALMTIKIVGKAHVAGVDDDMKRQEFFEEALANWTSARLRNPNLARHGNKNSKRKVEESKTELPNPEEPDNVPMAGGDSDSDGEAVIALQGLDEAADDAEHAAGASLALDSMRRTS